MSRAQNCFEPNPEYSPIRPQKVKNDPKIMTNSKVRFERNIENESCSTARVDPKTIFKSYPNPKNCPVGPQKFKNYPKIKSKSNVRIEGNLKNESCSTT